MRHLSSAIAARSCVEIGRLRRAEGIEVILLQRRHSVGEYSDRRETWCCGKSDSSRVDAHKCPPQSKSQLTGGATLALASWHKSYLKNFGIEGFTPATLPLACQSLLRAKITGARPRILSTLFYSHNGNLSGHIYPLQHCITCFHRYRSSQRESHGYPFHTI